MGNFIGIAMLVIFILMSGQAYANAEEKSSWDKLLEGNRRFITSNPDKKDLSESKKKDLLKGQHPYATILTCSDSRVPPEHIFDAGLGEIFIIRNAGNVVDPITIGSIEYGVEHLHTPVLVILGHSKCGAVTAAVESNGHAEGNIGEIIKEIAPSVEAAKKSNQKKSDLIDEAINENIYNTYEKLIKSSPVVGKLIKEGKLEIVLALYHLETGKVEALKIIKRQSK